MRFKICVPCPGRDKSGEHRLAFEALVTKPSYVILVGESGQESTGHLPIHSTGAESQNGGPLIRIRSGAE